MPKLRHTSTPEGRALEVVTRIERQVAQAPRGSVYTYDQVADLLATPTARVEQLWANLTAGIPGWVDADRDRVLRTLATRASLWGQPLRTGATIDGADTRTPERRRHLVAVPSPTDPFTGLPS